MKISCTRTMPDYPKVAFDYDSKSFSFTKMGIEEATGIMYFCGRDLITKTGFAINHGKWHGFGDVMIWVAMLQM